jgi:hypothetical protein
MIRSMWPTRNSGPVHPEALTADRNAVPPSIPFGWCGGGIKLDQAFRFLLGHSVGGITYRHYAHRAPLAFRAIMTLPQPTAFSALLNGCDGECPCCRRFADAA